jgi:hypothetical protein
VLFSKHPIKHRRKRIRPRLNLPADLHPHQPHRNLQLRSIRQHRLDSLKEFPDDPGQDTARQELTGRRVDENA